MKKGKESWEQVQAEERRAFWKEVGLDGLAAVIVTILFNVAAAYFGWFA